MGREGLRSARGCRKGPGAALHSEISGEPLKALLCGSDTAGFSPMFLLGSWLWRLGEVDGEPEKGGGKGRLAAMGKGLSCSPGAGRTAGPKSQNEAISSPSLVCLLSPFFQQTLRVTFVGGSGEAGRGSWDQGSGVCHIFLSAAPSSQPPSSLAWITAVVSTLHLLLSPMSHTLRTAA